MSTNQPNLDDQLCEASLCRPGDKVPTVTLDIFVVGERLRYCKYNRGGYETFILTPNDRKTSTLVIEDYATEKNEKIKARLREDRWANVLDHG